MEPQAGVSMQQLTQRMCTVSRLTPPSSRPQCTLAPRASLTSTCRRGDQHSQSLSAVSIASSTLITSQMHAQVQSQRRTYSSSSNYLERMTWPRQLIWVKLASTKGCSDRRRLMNRASYSLVSLQTLSSLRWKSRCKPSRTLSSRTSYYSSSLKLTRPRKERKNWRN